MARMEPPLRDVLRHSPTIAVLGIHDDPARAGCYVPAYLHRHGYRILGVNPGLVGRELFGSPVRATLAELDEPYQLVDVFRRAEHLPGHEAALAACPAAVIWFQQGIVEDAVAARLRAAGKLVIQDRCTLAEHRRLGLGAPDADSPLPARI
ncbi:MAG: CoA-binding protein [Myxococcales bacterium]|nr:CoA-binding protein [Myxococcales bacterium]